MNIVQFLNGWASGFKIPMKSGPFTYQRLFNHFKSRLVWILDHHFNRVLILVNLNHDLPLEISAESEMAVGILS